MLPYPNRSSSFLFDPPSSCFEHDLELANNTFVDPYNLPFFSFETPLPPPDPAPAPPKDRSGGAGGRRRCGRRQRNDRHSKIRTAQGLRDRRMRLSIEVAGRFFALQDMLGLEKASATVDWLLDQSKSAIEQAALSTTDVVIPSAVLSPKSADDSSHSLQTASDHHVLYEKAEGLQPSSAFRLSVVKTVSRRESRAEARARARCRTMEKKKKRLLEAAGDGGVGQFDSTEKAPSLVCSNLECSSCSSLSQGRRLVAGNINMREYNFECLPIAADGESSPLGMLGYIWDDADVGGSYELLPRSGIDGSVEAFQLR